MDRGTDKDSERISVLIMLTRGYRYNFITTAIQQRRCVNFIIVDNGYVMFPSFYLPWIESEFVVDEY